MASSSSSLLSTKHHVFLSFRGEDTRYNFVSHLYKNLRDKKIQTFTDDDLNRGDEISPALIRAIQVSKISVIIFSENYAESSWCLDELLRILRCRNEQNQIVIPVFYKVDPTNVRNQTGKFGSAFHKLLRNTAASKSGKKQTWRNALKSAANLSGFHSLNKGSEATLIDTIIADVLEKLKISSTSACDDRGLVGINSRKAEIMRLLRTESLESGMVGIWGMGGIGKTTIAGEVFNEMSLEFESSYFLGNVRVNEKNEGLASMRDKLISELLNDKRLEIHTPRIGDASIKDRLRRTKVLVVLDDVDKSSQLEVLIGERGMNQFGPGSRVIVTTRDKQVLNAHDITSVYDMEMLDDRDGLELFSYHALRPDQPMELYLEISEKIVEYSQGVPLALKILGSYLRGQTDLQHWEGVLKKLKKVPRMEILDVLKISYDSLDDEEKNIFLDIACFFKRTWDERFRNVLSSCYHSSNLGMKVLIDKSLIEIKSRDYKMRATTDMNAYASIDRVKMHDLIEEMGWNIVTEESNEIGSRSRIWRPEDVYDVLTKNTGTDKIKSIYLDMMESDDMNLDPQTFANMHNLKCLNILNSCAVDSKIQFPSGLESLPEGLRYLDWDGYPLEYLPPTFNPINMVELHLSRSRLKRLWSGTQNLRNLKVLNLHFCLNLVEIPDLSLATNLEELNLSDCCTLDKIPSSIQSCTSLTNLNLNHCDKLTSITSAIQCCTSLTNLNLSYCKGLTSITSFIHLTSLVYLNLENSYVREIPASIQYLTSLTHLNLNYTPLREIPLSIQYLTSLTHLDLGFHGLKEIPSSIQHLTNLTYLNLRSSVEYITSLIHSNLSDYNGRMDDISSIPHLNLQITKYTNLPKNIEFLEVEGNSIEVYPSSIALLTNLVQLVLWNCSGYQMSSDFLRHLKLLTPSGCKIKRHRI